MATQTGSAAEPNACERLSRRDAPVFDGEAALALCTAQLGAACTYRTLAARARGCVRQSLARLAEGKCREARRLAAVYFMMTGTKPCPKRSAAPAARSAVQRSCTAAMPRAAVNTPACWAAWQSAPSRTRRRSCASCKAFCAYERLAQPFSRGCIKPAVPAKNVRVSKLPLARAHIILLYSAVENAYFTRTFFSRAKRGRPSSFSSFVSP